MASLNQQKEKISVKIHPSVEESYGWIKIPEGLTVAFSSKEKLPAAGRARVPDGRSRNVTRLTGEIHHVSFLVLAFSAGV